jgi:hypothetical protein
VTEVCSPKSQPFDSPLAVIQDVPEAPESALRNAHVPRIAPFRQLNVYVQRPSEENDCGQIVHFRRKSWMTVMALLSI